MIRCIKGRIKVVYEDQGEPFWLEPGDWVIQPPEIRHRVLECEAGSEVIEVSMPAEHETWVDHEMTLPTTELRPNREFNGQRFVRFIAPK
jgi:quercetin dioxygenase-like cupin family protein